MHYRYIARSCRESGVRRWALLAGEGQRWNGDVNGNRADVWIDDHGITHTIALPDPAAGMSPDAVRGLDALTEKARSEILDALDDWYWNEYVSGEARSQMIAEGLGPSGVPLPDGYITAVIASAGDAVAVVRATDPAWRIDVLEALQDYLEADSE